MVMKKITDGDSTFIVNVSGDKNSFPIGFKYSMDGTIYTVKKNITKDTGSEMRRLVTSEGGVEDVSVETIIKDLKEPGIKILDDGKKIEEKTSEDKEKEKDSK
jgi:hypothetical protein